MSKRRARLRFCFLPTKFCHSMIQFSGSVSLPGLAAAQLPRSAVKTKSRSSVAGNGGLAAGVEVEVEVVVEPHHRVAEAVGGHGEFQRHEERLRERMVELIPVFEDVFARSSYRRPASGSR